MSWESFVILSHYQQYRCRHNVVVVVCLFVVIIVVIIVCYHSDPHTVLDILVQQLLSNFSSNFVDKPSLSSSYATSPNLERKNLLSFLQQEENLLLLATIQHLSLQVSYNVE